MCLISALSAVTTNLTFTTGIYIAPVRDLITVAKSVGTAAVLSHNRVRLGVGVGWCEEEYIQTGQDFHNRGKRLNDMIPALRALWQGGWVEYHGTHYDVPPCQMNPAPRCRCPSCAVGTPRRPWCGPPPCATAGSTPGRPLPDEAFVQAERIQDALKRAGRENDAVSRCTWPSRPTPISTCTGGSRTPGSPTSCALRGWRCEAEDGDTPETLHAKRAAVCEQFAEHIIGAFA